MDSNLARRVGFAVVAIPLALIIVWYGGVPLVGLLAVAGALGARELFDLAARQGIRALRGFGLISAAALAPLAYATVVSPEFRGTIERAWPYAAAVWLMALLTGVLAARSPGEKPMSVTGVTLLAVAYTGALPAFLLAIRHAQYPVRSWTGAWLVFFPLVVTWVCDTAAMFGGRTFGGPRLAPTVSPGKTWSGSTAGFVGGIVIAPLFAGIVFPRVGLELPVWQLAIIAGALSIIGQIGDLAESLFKREAGVKDSSHLIPGHGGVLDRFDSLYFVIPAAAVLYRLFGVI
ncbi:MAG: phosphatidate cytidylyltransferase [Gemmatimonadales bacterium]